MSGNNERPKERVAEMGVHYLKYFSKIHVKLSKIKATENINDVTCEVCLGLYELGMR